MSQVIDSVLNFQRCTVLGTYDAAATTIDVDDASNIAVPGNAVYYRSDAFNNPLDDPNAEVVRITGKNVGTVPHKLTIVRGSESALGGRVASAKNIVSAVYRIVPCLTANTWEQIAAAAVDVGFTVYITEKGGTGNGTANDTQPLIDSIAAGNDIVLPPGTWLIDGGIGLKSNIRIRGAGMGVTIIQLKNSAGAVSMFTGTALSRITFENLTIDGNESNNATALDAIGLDGILHLTMDNVEIRFIRGNGMNLGANSGSSKYVWVRGCKFLQVRGHCIAIANRNNDNESVVITECHFDSPGYGGATAKAAVAARGKVQIDACSIRGVAGDNYGIWLRPDDGTLGLSAKYSQVSNIYIVGTTAASGTICEGVRAEAPLCDFSMIIVESCDYGFHAMGDDCNYIQCRSLLADAGFYVEGDNNLIKSCYLQASGSGKVCIDVRAAADHTRIYDCRILDQSSATKVTVSGTNTHARSNIGWKTHTRVVSATVAVDGATGGKNTGNVAHGLDVTPAVGDCIISFVIGNGDTTFRAGTLRIESADATNVVANFATTTAGGAGATIKVGFDINVYP